MTEGLGLISFIYFSKWGREFKALSSAGVLSSHRVAQNFLAKSADPVILE